MKTFNNVIVVVLDSLGAGELPDASNYGDVGSNTLGHTATAVGGLKLPNLGRLGLGNIIEVEGVPPTEAPLASFGKMAEVSAGKDTTTGHWEMSGLVLDKPFPVFPEGFPDEVINEFEKRIGRRTLGNVVASGTEIIERLGEEHMKSGFPIVYTSADSVFQIAAHEEIIPVEELYVMCRAAREILTGPNAVGRVIARPFIGSPGAFKRTANRHDFSVEPIGPTVLDLLKEGGLAVSAVGKINDIFAGRGITDSVHTKSNSEGIDRTVDFVKQNKKGLIFTNLVDLDSSFGHRNDPAGYGAALEDIDLRLPKILEVLSEDQLLIITADHGCDPTTSSTDHSREYVPLLVYNSKLTGTDLGIRHTFSDVAATIAENFGLNFQVGISFLSELGKNHMK